MTEKDLAQHFVKYLSCYDLYFEVDYFRSVDIVALEGGVSSAYEVKTTFNFKVLEQAVINSKYFNFSYICVPCFNDWSFQKRLCNDYGIGLLVFDDHARCDTNEIIELVRPQLNRHTTNLLLKNRLHQINKLSKPGTKSGDSEKITAFSITAEQVARFVGRNPGCTMKDMVNQISHHYDNDRLACVNLSNWIRSGVIKGIEVKDKKLYCVE